jgi:hypothetical protein
MNRRQFLLASGLFITLPKTLLAETGDYSPVMSASRLEKGKFRIGQWQKDGWATAADIPHRGHDSCAHSKNQELLFFSRRPDREIFILDARNGQPKQQVMAQDGYHYYGHGCLDAQERFLYTTENHVAGDGQGAIGVYDSQDNYRFVKHLSCAGIGPHQLAMMPDNKTLVVAVGGIKTLPQHGRDTLNFDSMAPALNYIDIDSGELLESQASPHQHLSLRHLDVGSKGLVVVGGQYQGSLPAPLPLVYQHQRGKPLQAMDTGDVPLRLNKSYVASISIDSLQHYAVSTCPRDNTVCLWNLANGQLQQSFRLLDCAGAVYDARYQQFILSNGRGQLMALSPGSPALRPLAYASGIHWDNHLRLAQPS